MIRRLSSIFLHDGRIAKPVVVAFIFLNGLVLLNAFLHDPKVGYDASQHLAYVKSLAGGHLPTPEKSAEFFCPPLPYAPAALVLAVFSRANDEAWKFAQLVQAACSIVLSIFMLKLCRLMRGGVVMQACALLCLAMIPAYVRTFAMIRGEPMLAMFAVVGIYLTLKTFAIDRPTIKAAAITGLVIGLSVLCRQWAFFLLPPLALVGVWRLIVDAPQRRATIFAGLTTLATFAVVATPFYAYLHVEYGSVRAFNRVAATDDEPLDATEKYEANPPGESWHLLFTEPVRHNFAVQPGFLFYADLWGDYWQYFSVWGEDARGRFVPAGKIRQTYRARPRTPTNYGSIRGYLGRCAIVGFVPTAMLVIGLVAGAIAFRWRRVDDDLFALIRPLLTLLVLSTAAGYVWSIANYPNRNFDTVKASYPMQAYPLLALLAASVLDAVHKRHPRVAMCCITLLGLVALHNLPAAFTRYFG